MRNRYLFQINGMKYLPRLLLLSLAFLVSCESNELTNTSLEKKLVLNPTSLEGEQYVQYTFKAKVTNVPFSDVTIYWDFDEGRGYHADSNLNMQYVQHTFYEPRIYNVRVKAVDFFSEEVLGLDSIRVDVRPPVAFVDLSPNVLDTVLPISINGRTEPPIYFTVKTSSPLNLIKTVWDYGDGEIYEDSVSPGDGGNYFLPGPHTVRVSAYEKSGRYLGSDSAIVTVRFPSFTIGDLSRSKSIVAALRIDSLHPVAKDSLFLNPLAVQFTKSDTVVRMQFGATDLYLWYDKESNLGGKTQQHDTLHGVLSDDLRSIRSLNVIVRDSGFTLYPFASKLVTLRYTYELTNLELFAVNNSMIVYSSKSNSLSDFLNALSFSAAGNANYAAGSFAPNSGGNFIPSIKPGVFGLVIFNR
jgi:hypothetical protein